MFLLSDALKVNGAVNLCNTLSHTESESCSGSLAPLLIFIALADFTAVSADRGLCALRGTTCITGVNGFRSSWRFWTSSGSGEQMQRGNKSFTRRLVRFQVFEDEVCRF